MGFPHASCLMLFLERKEYFDCLITGIFALQEVSYISSKGRKSFEDLN